MLVGEYRNKVDSKKRVPLPKKFREVLGDKLILTRGYEGCLILVSAGLWEQLTKGVLKGPFTKGAVRDTSRFLFAGAYEISLDKQGRFVIPKNLCEYAQIEKEACFLGLGRWVEIWNVQRWNERLEFLSSKGSKIAEKLSELDGL